MKAVWKKRWLKALRSGEYKQGVGYLKNGDEFCCLGVLCDLAGVRWKDGSCKFGNGGLNPRGTEFFGLTEADQTHFIDMNDGRGRSFKQIARSAENLV